MGELLSSPGTSYQSASREVQGGSRCSGGSSNVGAGSRSLQEVPRLVWFGVHGDAEAIGIEDASLKTLFELATEMNKRKLILGVFITALGGIIMLTSMVSGIIYFAANLYEDIHTFPAKLPDSPLSSKTDNFREKRGNEVSVWLKVHNRQIENKDFVISVSFVGENGEKKAEFAENFRFGYLRNSAGKGQYYKLGSHLFENDFSGYLSYTTSGTWIPPFEGFLVIRRSQGLPLPLRQISVFLIGIIILITGIGTIAKNRKRSAID